MEAALNARGERLLANKVRRAVKKIIAAVVVWWMAYGQARSITKTQGQPQPEVVMKI